MDPSVTTTESPPSAQRTFRSILPPRASVMALVAMAAAFAPGVLPYWTYQLDPKPHLQFAILDRKSVV